MECGDLSGVSYEQQLVLVAELASRRWAAALRGLRRTDLVDSTGSPARRAGGRAVSRYGRGEGRPSAGSVCDRRSCIEPHTAHRFVEHDAPCASGTGHADHATGRWDRGFAVPARGCASAASVNGSGHIVKTSTANTSDVATVTTTAAESLVSNVTALANCAINMAGGASVKALQASGSITSVSQTAAAAYNAHAPVILCQERQNMMVWCCPKTALSVQHAIPQATDHGPVIVFRHLTNV